MSILSFNIRGVEGVVKVKALFHVFKVTNPNIVFIQESMCCESHEVEVFSRILSGWNYCALDSNGLSGGIISCWNPQVSYFKPYKTYGSILLVGKFNIAKFL